MNIRIIKLYTRNNNQCVLQSGKTRLANFLCDIPNDLPEEMQPTKALRIVEYDLSNIDIDGCESNVDIQLWDTSGDEM